jgi:hypothetical protein
MRDSYGDCLALLSGTSAVAWDRFTFATESNHDDALTDVVWTLPAPARAEQSSHLVRI